MSKPTTTVAAPNYEWRMIMLVQGIQFNNKDEDPEDRVPTGYLKDQLGGKLIDAPSILKGLFWYYVSEPQGVLYFIAVGASKEVYKRALETAGKKADDPSIHVIYDGHSRYGRGACFGTDQSPGEDWETGTKPNETGLYRLGFPYVGIPVQDIEHHRYTLDVVPSSEKLPLSDCEPDLANFVKAKTLVPIKLNKIPAHLQGFLRINKAPVKATDKFWGFHWPGEGLTVVTHAGWTSTAADPMDLGATNLQCRVFCHFGCSSKQHYREIVRNRKNFKLVKDTDGFAFFTSNVSYSVTASFWLHRLLTYDKYNAFKPWGPSLDYAKKMANKDLKDWCKTNHHTLYQIA